MSVADTLVESADGMAQGRGKTHVDPVAAFVPEDRLLIETDAPFLAPVPHRGKRNEPAWVAETLKQLATLRSKASDEIDARVTANFTAFVGRRVDTPAKPMV